MYPTPATKFYFSASFRYFKMQALRKRHLRILSATVDNQSKLFPIQCFYTSRIRMGNSFYTHTYVYLYQQPLRPGSSGKGIGRVCGRFQVQVPMGTKIYLSRKKMFICTSTRIKISSFKYSLYYQVYRNRIFP